MTGTLAVYTLSISFGICICTPGLKKQSSIILKKETQISQSNEAQEDTSLKESKFRDRTKGKFTHTTPESQHKKKQKLTEGKPK